MLRMDRLDTAWLLGLNFFAALLITGIERPDAFGEVGRYLQIDALRALAPDNMMLWFVAFLICAHVWLIVLRPHLKVMFAGLAILQCYAFWEYADTLVPALMYQFEVLPLL